MKKTSYLFWSYFLFSLSFFGQIKLETHLSENGQISGEWELLKGNRFLSKEPEIFNENLRSVRFVKDAEAIQYINKVVNQLDFGIQLNLGIDEDTGYKVRSLGRLQFRYVDKLLDGYYLITDYDGVLRLIVLDLEEKKDWRSLKNHIYRLQLQNQLLTVGKSQYRFVTTHFVQKTTHSSLVKKINSKAGLNFNDLKGKVKETETLSYERLDFGKSLTSREKSSKNFQAFDKRGNQIQSENHFYFTDTILQESSIIEGNFKKNKVKDRNGIFLRELKGNEYVTTHVTDSITYIQSKVVIENGRKMKTTVFSPNAKQLQVINYTYNQFGLLSNTVMLDENNTLLLKNEYYYLVFDAQNNWIKRIRKSRYLGIATNIASHEQTTAYNNRYDIEVREIKYYE